MPTAAATLAPTVAPTAPATASASAAPSEAASQAPAVTIVPGSSLDVTQSDSGVAGRFTIANGVGEGSLRPYDRTGTHEILGRDADGSDCSYSFSGDTFTAVAWYDDAPNEMLHQLTVVVPADEMPSNDGEQRAGIADGRVYADFSSDQAFGTAYSGDVNEESNGGTSTIDVVQKGDTITFSFSGTTWDKIDFSGQMICAGVTDS
jgi:hypothetical protein